MKHFVKQQQPHHRKTLDSRLKLHLYLVPIGNITYRVLMPRPNTQVRFSTNYFHDTWHIISDTFGAHFLARVLWGLSYQRQAQTLVFLSGEFIAPNPFDAEPSEPIILTSSQLTPLNARHFTQLRHKMKNIGKPETTVRLLTFGLDAAIKGVEEAEQESVEPYFSCWPVIEKYSWWPRFDKPDPREVMRRCGGCICYAAPPDILRYQAFATKRLDPGHCGMDYHYLSGHWGKTHAVDGEIQIFKEYQAMLRDAAVARREVEDQQGNVTTLECDREKVQQQALKVRQRRKKAERKP